MARQHQGLAVALVLLVILGTQFAARQTSAYYSTMEMGNESSWIHRIVDAATPRRETPKLPGDEQLNETKRYDSTKPTLVFHVGPR